MRDVLLLSRFGTSDVRSLNVRCDRSQIHKQASPSSPLPNPDVELDCVIVHPIYAADQPIILITTHVNQLSTSINYHRITPQTNHNLITSFTANIQTGFITFYTNFISNDCGRKAIGRSGYQGEQGPDVWKDLLSCESAFCCLLGSF